MPSREVPVISPRWRKVLRDLSSNRTRTLLVIASIAVGIFAVGTVQKLQAIILSELQAVYNRSNAAHATVFAAGLDSDLLESVRKMPEVAAAEGRNSLAVTVQTAPGTWESMNVTAIEDFATNQINLLQPLYTSRRHPGFGAELTTWPTKDQIVLERSALDSSTALPAGLRLGDTLNLQTESGKARSVTVSGLVYDANAFPSAFTNSASGYVDFDTFERLGGSRSFFQINLRFTGTPEQLLDKEYITRLADEVGSKIEKSGRAVQRIQVPEPGELLFQSIFDSLALLLTPLGLLALFLSGFLVVNTISALMAQQVRQIGVMKSIGAQRGQIISMYLGTIFFLSLLALAVAIPITTLVAGGILQFLGTFINVDFPVFALPLHVLLIEVGVGVIVPLLAALYPIYRGTGVTVREAISDYGVGNGGEDWLGQLLARIRVLGRPLQISLRNTFRRRARLVVTLIMLVLGGMIFMTVGSVRASLAGLIEQGLAYNQFDIQIQFGRAYRTAQIEQIVRTVSGVEGVESWQSGLITRIRPDGTESNPLTVFALPAESAMVQPALAEGRWLLAGDENAIVISQNVLNSDDDITVGSWIVLDVAGKEGEWAVVGIVQSLSGPPNQIPVYVNLPYYARYTNSVGQGDSVQITVNRSAFASLDEAVQIIETTLEASGLRVASTFTVDLIRQISGGFFDIIIYLLSGMGVLIATVGALGLMGTMSTNVLERTREIGVMRAIGASDGAVQRIVIVEGVIIGLISWLIGAALAFPMGAVLSTAVGQALFSRSLPYTFSSGGVVAWFVIVALLAAFASFLPAWNASRLTVREVLAYE